MIDPRACPPKGKIEMADVVLAAATGGPLLAEPPEPFRDRLIAMMALSYFMSFYLWHA